MYMYACIYAHTNVYVERDGGSVCIVGGGAGGGGQPSAAQGPKGTHRVRTHCDFLSEGVKGKETHTLS